MVGVNIPIPVPVAYHSFGGWKRSAFGDVNQHGPEGMRFYTKIKTVHTAGPKALRKIQPLSFPQQINPGTSPVPDPLSKTCSTGISSGTDLHTSGQSESAPTSQHKGHELSQVIDRAIKALIQHVKEGTEQRSEALKEWARTPRFNPSSFKHSSMV